MKATKVFVATNETQGERRSDFFYCEENEPVYIGSECTTGRIDDGCGCRRCWTGMVSGKGTTTARVVEWPGSFPAYVDLLTMAFVRAYGLPRGIALQSAYCMVRKARPFRLGVVVERRGHRVRPRSVADGGDWYE